MSSKPNEQPDSEFWFNIRTGKVEFGKQSAAVYRIGPFATREEAEAALEKVAERSRQWLVDEGED